MMSAAGFEDVTEVRKQFPLNPWPKDPEGKRLGELGKKVFATDMEMMSLALMPRYLGLAEDEVKARVVGVKRDIMDEEVHAYMPL